MTWRVGHKVARNIYVDDEPIAMLATPEMAKRIVDAMNARDAAWNPVRAHAIRFAADVVESAGRMGYSTDDIAKNLREDAKRIEEE